jgi:hypothetical protein
MYWRNAMSEGFYTSAWVAMVFFRFCARYKINDREDRVLVLRELTRRKKVRYIRDVKPILAKVLKIGFKPSHNAGPEHYCPECRPKESK